MTLAHHPGSLEDRADACSTDGAGVDVQQLAASYVGALGIAQHRQRLPIASVRTAFLYAVETTPVTLVVADTATGKSTQLPQFLHEAGWTDERHAVVCTQVYFRGREANSASRVHCDRCFLRPIHHPAASHCSHIDCATRCRRDGRGSGCGGNFI